MTIIVINKDMTNEVKPDLIDPSLADMANALARHSDPLVVCFNHSIDEDVEAVMRRHDVRWM